ncbi:MAG: hypothetical protein HY788_09610 [Deltaproteobacteria bacterium]|nr:hypothetical protein [Deltaproteobacteria bacterium]
MRWKAICILLAVATAYFFCMASPLRAQDRALQQLVELLEQKGALTPAEAETMRRIIARDQRLLLEKEQALEQREQELLRREQALAEKEPEQAKPLPSEESKPSPGEKEETGLALEAVYEEGFWLRTTEPDVFSLRVGGLLQTDYRYYDYDSEDPDQNKFDIRRARLLLEGWLTSHFDYKFEYEFQGAGSRRLLDAYGDVHLLPYLSVRLGQFKEPFSLEQVTKDKNIVFAERSMGYYLTPGRDLGVMVHASVWDDRVNYGLGLFNGDGEDDATGGDVDEPEFTGRLVFAPFREWGLPWLEDFQIGGSLGYARIDRNNVNINVKTTGLTTFFDVATSAKFNVIREADKRYRYGAELGWAYGPFALASEYIKVQYRDITTSADQFDVDLEDTYVSLLWMVTGERPTYKNGIFKAIRSEKRKRTLWRSTGTSIPTYG